METPKEYYYTYYSYEEWGRGYIGSRGCKCLPEEDVNYFGSFKDKTFNPTKKIILKSDYSTREESYIDEIILQEYYKVVENPHFANRAYQTSTKFCIPREQAIKNGKIGGAKTKKLGAGFFTLSANEHSKNGKSGGEKSYELGLGVHSRNKEKMSEDGKKGGMRTHELGVGIFAISKELKQEIGKKVGIKTKELGIGIHALTTEQRRENGKKGGKSGGEKSYELGLGIHGLSKEQRIEISRNAGKIGSKKTNSQKWQCTETGFITNAGTLSRYQKARGIDKSKRIRIE